MSFPHWSRTLTPFKQANSYRSAQKPDRRRKASRKESISNAWIALDGGFAVRSCSVVDLSNTGVQIKIDPADFVTELFHIDDVPKLRNWPACSRHMAAWIEDRRPVPIEEALRPSSSAASRAVLTRCWVNGYPSKLVIWKIKVRTF